MNPYVRTIVGVEDTNTAHLEMEKFMNAKHILVKNKYEAEDILKLLKRGESFEKLAIKFSQCASAPQGGDLGNLNNKKNLDENFKEALEGLKPNEVSSIVRTSFGYHLILIY